MECVTFNVKYYPGDSVQFKIPLNRLTYNSYGKLVVRVLSLKKAIGRALKLKDDSLGIFGLFSGRLGCPAKLCLGYCIVDLVYMDFSFQRLASSAEEEIEVIAADDRALELIFWEVKFRYETSKIYSRPKEELRKNLELQERFTRLVISSKSLMTKLTQEYRQNQARCSFRNHSVFVEVVRKLPLHYLSYYYIIESCTLKHSLSTSPLIKVGSAVTLVIDFDMLIALDLSGNAIAAWCWDDIDIIHPQMTTWPDDEPLRGKFYTPCMYFYTLSKHFQRERRNRFFQ